MSKITTSVKIDETVYKNFRKLCIDKGIEYAEGMSEALKEWTTRNK